MFGGSAFLQLPLVRDHAAFKLFIDAASNQYLYDPSTDIAAALKAALAVFEHEGSHGSRAIILLSDGESQPEAVVDVTPVLQRERIPVIAIGVGTPEGGPVPADSTRRRRSWHRDHIGTGRQLAARGRGADPPGAGDRRRLPALARGRQTWARWWSGSRQVQARVLESAAAGSERADRFQWPLAAGLLLLLVELFLGARPHSSDRFRERQVAVGWTARSRARGSPDFPAVDRRLPGAPRLHDG